MAVGIISVFPSKLGHIFGNFAELPAQIVECHHFGSSNQSGAQRSVQVVPIPLCGTDFHLPPVDDKYFVDMPKDVRSIKVTVCEIESSASRCAEATDVC